VVDDKQVQEGKTKGGGGGKRERVIRSGQKKKQKNKLWGKMINYKKKQGQGGELPARHKSEKAWGRRRKKGSITTGGEKCIPDYWEKGKTSQR